MRVCLTKRVVEPWLIAGTYSKRLKSPHEKTCIVGSIFEELTATLLNGSRLSLNSNFECCPDVVKPFTLIESKASCRTCFVIHERQLINYREIWSEHIQSVWFALWRYRKVDGLPTVDVFTEKVISSVQDMWLLDFPVIERLIRLAPTMYYIRGCEGHIGYHRVASNALQDLFASPEEFAGEAFNVGRCTHRLDISIDGVQYSTPEFQVVSVLERVPF